MAKESTESTHQLLPKHSIVSRKGVGTLGRRIPLLANHFRVSVGVPDAVFYQYSVSIKYEDERPVEGKGIGRKLMDKLYQTYSSEFSGKRFAYDGEKALYTVGPLPQKKLEFTVVLEDSVSKGYGSILSEHGSPGSTSKRSKHSMGTKTFKVEINYAAMIPLKPVVLALKGVEADSGAIQDAVRVLDIILRQQAASRGCLLVRQSFFHDDSRNYTDVGQGVSGLRGFHSSFRTTQGGFSLNMDVSTTMVVTPGPVVDFLLTNQGVREPQHIDWDKARRMLRNLRIKATHNNREFKIIGLSENSCNRQLFSMKVRNSGGPSGEPEQVELTVTEYYKQLGIQLRYSGNFPCLNVGKPKRPTYLPLELCSLISLQRYTKSLSTMQRASLVEKSRQKPQDRMRTLTDAMSKYRYDEDPLLAECGISIAKVLTPINGRVLETPKLKVGNDMDCIPNNGRWNFNNKLLLRAVSIEKWGIVNFSAQCDMSNLSRELVSCGRKKGIRVEGPMFMIEESHQFRRSNPLARVEGMFKQVREKLPGSKPQFILCVLPQRKNSDIYGPWKKKCLSDFGIVTQCIAPPRLIKDQYLTNVLLKINAKLGGVNSMLEIEHSRRIPLITKVPTMILGMDVSHGSPGRSDVPSVAAVVGSLEWPHITRYSGAVRTQSPKVEMIDALHKPLPNGEDDGIMRKLFVSFYKSSGHKPRQIIIFRDGVSESQFNQVLNIELPQIIKAYQHLGEVDVPKFTVIIAQKNHHTKLFKAQGPDNVPPGTVVDTTVVHPRNYDFYMCAHNGAIGTSRPAHYHVLIDEIGFTPDELQNLVHSLSYVYQRSTTAISIVAPVCYAHLAAQQMSQFMKFDDMGSSEKSSEAMTSVGAPLVPELPRLKDNVADMFFC
ncbi:Protein argonaute 16 [Linum perenne]